MRALACGAQPLPYRHAILQTYRDPHDVRRADVELCAVMAPSRDNRARRRRFSDGMHEQRFTSRSGRFVYRRHAGGISSIGRASISSARATGTEPEATPRLFSASRVLIANFPPVGAARAACRNADAVEPETSESSSAVSLLPTRQLAKQMLILRCGRLPGVAQHRPSESQTANA